MYILPQCWFFPSYHNFNAFFAKSFIQPKNVIPLSPTPSLFSLFSHSYFTPLTIIFFFYPYIIFYHTFLHFCLLFPSFSSFYPLPLLSQADFNPMFFFADFFSPYKVPRIGLNIYPWNLKSWFFFSISLIFFFCIGSLDFIVTYYPVFRKLKPKNLFFL